MLKQRIITAIVLLALFALTALANQAIYFAIFSAILAMGCAWEMMRMITLACQQLSTASKPSSSVAVGTLFKAPIIRILFVHVPAILLFALFIYLAVADLNKTTLFQIFFYINLFLAFAWLILVPMLMIVRDDALARLSTQLILGLFVLLSITSTWFTVWVSYDTKGLFYLFSWMGIVWIADIMAYFGGKFFGGRKLAVSISPGKTLSGALCGIVAGTIWAFAFTAFDDSFTNDVLRNPYSTKDWIGPIIAGLVISVLSIVGDLFESMIKRHVGLKDSSQLLPGHGGIWDRMDSVLAITPVVYLFWYLTA